jgi:exopolysaccharide production protein ExoY
MAFAGLIILSNDGFSPFVQLPKAHPSVKGVKVTKLRSMIPNAHEMEKDVMEKTDKTLRELKRTRRDPRVTRVGSFFRETSIDEVPQVFDVLQGYLSLIGPRPYSLMEWNMDILPNSELNPYNEFIGLLEDGLKYGITGVSAVCGRSDLEAEDRLYLETLYGKYASARVDLKILALTIPTVISRRGAY